MFVIIMIVGALIKMWRQIIAMKIYRRICMQYWDYVNRLSNGSTILYLKPKSLALQGKLYRQHICTVFEYDMISCVIVYQEIRNF